MDKYEKAIHNLLNDIAPRIKSYETLQNLVERAKLNNYVVTEYCKMKLVETTIASNLSKKDAHRLRELLNAYANKENKVRYKCYEWSK